MTKFITITAIAASLATSGFAQPEKETKVGLHLPTQQGSWMAGANVVRAGIAFGGGQKTSYNFGISPRIGYFVADNIALGASLTATIAGASHYYRSSSAGGSIFARYYFGKAADKAGNMKKWRFFMDAEAGYGHGKSKLITDPNTPTWNYAKTDYLTYRAGVGANYFFNKNVALETGISWYRSSLLDPNQAVMGDRQSNINFNVGLQIYFGKR